MKIAVLLALLLCTSVKAFAEEPKKPYRSPQHFMIELKLGPYSPNIDDEFSGNVHPFKDIFGSGTRVSFLAEFDYQFWHKFGSMGVGVSSGWYTASAEPFADDGADGSPATPGDTNRVAGRTSITLIPIALLYIYRFDVMANRLGIPLVPYAKAGFNYTFWNIKAANGKTATYQGKEGSGGTWGWQVQAGLALQLDFLEGSAAKKLDNGAGINHSYLFAEVMHVQADNFGSSDALNVGDSTLFGGLSFEF